MLRLRRAGAAQAAQLVAGWSGHAAVDDPGYRLVRDFERNVSARAFEALAAPAIARWPDFRWRAPQRFTDVARRLVEAGGLVEGTGKQETRTRGRPAELFRFRRDVLRERPAPGVGLPGSRSLI